MTRKIFRSCFLVAVTVLLASLLLIMGALYEYFDSQYEEELRQETAYIAQGVEQGGLAYCQALEQERNLNTRITWIESDGTVRYDSQADASSLENHADREEVQQAMRNGTGFSVRRSDTLGRQTLNCAVRLDDGTVLRVSGMRTTVWMLLGGMLPPIFLCSLWRWCSRSAWRTGSRAAWRNPSTTSTWSIRWRTTRSTMSWLHF